MIAKLILQTLLYIAGMGALLFIAAGTWRWPAAWVFLAAMAVLGLGSGVWLAKTDPALLAERMRPMMQEEQPAADKKFMLVFGFAALAWFMVIGFDRRWHWSEMPMALQALGYVLLLAATAFMLRVVRENSFAAPVVKVQAERGHRVIDTGPYAFVRHPMYSGAVLYFVAMALAIPLGIAAGWWKPFDHTIGSILELLRPLPALALIPLAIVWLGFGEVSKIALIAYASFFSIYLNTRAGVQNVDPLHVKVVLMTARLACC